MSYQDEISIIKLVRDTCYQPFKVNKAMTVAIQSMEKLQEYEKLGTLEEVRKAVKKQIPKKVTNASNGDKLMFGTCPSCNKRISNVEGGNYCQNCGNVIDWR